jgi:CBS domain-containing protein
MVKPRSPASETAQLVSDIMFDPEPVIEQSAHLAAAAYLMRHAQRPELVVVDGEASRKPVAIITSFDVVRAVSHASNPSEATVAQWQSPEPEVVRPHTPLLEALDVMLEQTRPHLPVVDDDGQLVGVIDLIRLARAIRPLLDGRGTSQP